MRKLRLEDLCNGSTPDSDSVCGGSNPSSSAKKKNHTIRCGFSFCHRMGIRTHLNAICQWHIAVRRSRRRTLLINNRIPHPLPLRKQRRQCCSDYFCFPLVGEESQQAKNHQPPESEKLMVFRVCGYTGIACTVKKYIA